MEKLKTFFTWLGTVGIIAWVGFVFVTIAMPVLFPSKPSEVSVPATIAPDVKRKPPTKPVTIKAPVLTYDDSNKARLKLPTSSIENKSEHVIAATQVKGSDRPQTTTTTIDEATGEVKTFTKTDPYPWLAAEGKGFASMAYGYKYSHIHHQSSPVGRLTIGYDAIRVKALTVGVVGSVDSDSTAFAGIALTYRW